MSDSPVSGTCRYRYVSGIGGGLIIGSLWKWIPVLGEPWQLLLVGIVLFFLGDQASKYDPDADPKVSGGDER